MASRAVADVPRHLRVIWREDPATEATVSWTTASESLNASLEIRERDEGGWRTVESARNGAFRGSSKDWFHHVRFTDLKPSTAYEIRMPDDDESRWFRTAPADDVPFALISGGDSRSGIEHRQKINRMMADVVTEQAAADRPAVVALAHGGDFIVDGTRLDQWLQWLDDHELTSTSDGQLLPVIPTRGNHDRGPLFNQVWDFPDDDDNYYHTALTPAVTLVTLNTETSTAGDQRDWLAETLPEVRANSRWLLAQYHKPAFPAVKVPQRRLCELGPVV